MNILNMLLIKFGIIKNIKKIEDDNRLIEFNNILNDRKSIWLLMNCISLSNIINHGNDN